LLLPIEDFYRTDQVQPHFSKFVLHPQIF
jgi:hypothetical protein